MNLNRFVLFMLFWFGFIMNSHAGQSTPVHLNAMTNQLLHGDSEKWTKPDYSNQEGRLGYDPKDFEIPAGLQNQVQFWMDIYSKHDSNTGVIHDAEHIDAIYEIVKFPQLKGSAAEQAQILKQRRQLVKDAKARAKKRLDRLHIYAQKKWSPINLPQSEQDLWNKFSSEKSAGRFARAKKKDRLRMQLGQKDQFQLAIYYSGRYLRKIETIFANHGLPKELTRLPIVESSFNILAQSKVGASGIWQFMKFAARPYMKINSIVDERNDPITATEAAAKMLKGNYRMLKKWPLAITAYNYGPSGLRRLVRKYKTDDMSELIQTAQHRRFGFASKNFFPSYLAALLVEKNADQYFENPVRALPVDRQRLVVDRPFSWKNLLSLFSGDKNLTRIFNPFFTHRVRKGAWKIPKGYTVYIPEEKTKDAKRLLATLPLKEKVKKYRIRRGDTLSHIAERFGISVRKIMDYNGLRSAHRIRQGQVLKIPN